MRKFMTAGLCAAAAMMLLAGCSGNKAATGTGASESSQSESSAQAETEGETEEYVAESSIKLGEYKGIPVTVAKMEVTDEQVQSQIDQIINGRITYPEVDRAAKDGDTVNIDYKGLLNGEAFSGGTDEGYDLVLGSHSFIDGFEEGLIGVKKGDKRDLYLTFPETYGNQELAGKEVVFEVTVNAVKEKVVPVLNDEFVKENFPEQGTVEKFRAALREEMESYRQYEIDTQRETDLLNAIIDGSEIVCSTDAVDKAYDKQLNAITNEAEVYGMDLATFAMVYGTDEAGLKSQIRDMAKELAKQELVLQEIAKNENISIVDADRESLAEESGFENAAALIGQYGQEDVDQTALYRKVMSFIVNNAKITVLDGTEAAQGETQNETAAEESKAQDETAAEESKAQDETAAGGE